MMKKRVFILTTIFMLLITVAIADTEIVLPNGLQFGMTLTEAIAISGYGKGDRAPITDARLTAMGFDCDYLVGQASIGGHQASVKVFFDENYLRQIIYILASVDRKGSDSGVSETIEASWVSVGDALKQKYGQPQETSHQYKNSFVEYSFYSGNSKRKETDHAYPKEGFVVNVSDGSVYIDNYVVNRMNSTDSGSLNALSVGRKSLIRHLCAPTVALLSLTRRLRFISIARNLLVAPLIQER